MKTINLSNGNSITVLIRNANEKDIEQLMPLNQKWQKAALTQTLKNGYLGASFSQETFSELIAKNQVVLAEFDKNIIGYYLLNNVSKDGVIGMHAAIVTHLKSNGGIDEKLKVCVGAQAVVDKDFMGSGIRLFMLTKLVDNVRNSYDFLFSTIAKDNPRAYKAHTKDGWFVVDENETLFYVLYKV